MRIKFLLVKIFVLALFLTLFNSYLAVGQTAPTAITTAITTRPRRVGVETMVGHADLVGATAITTGGAAVGAAHEPGPDALVPRDGLQVYLEIRSEGFAQLVRAGSALEPLRKLLAGTANSKAGSELPAFVM